MGVREHEIPDETWEKLTESVRNYCKDTVQDPARGNHVRTKDIKSSVSDLFPSDVTSPRVQGRWVGSILNEAAYAEKWSRGTYRIDPDRV